MTINKIINMTEKTELNIINATLLTIEEVEKLPKRLREYPRWWWLRSPDNNQYCPAHVNREGSVLYNGVSIYFDVGCVRPALRIKLNSSNFKIGDSFIFADKEFEIITENLAFCRSDIGYHRFNKVSSNYETSEIKNYIENWFESNIK